MLSERLDKRVKKYLEEKKKKEEEEKRSNQIYKDAQRIWDEFTKHLESLDDRQLAEGVLIVVRIDTNNHAEKDITMIAEFKEKEIIKVERIKVECINEEEHLHEILYKVMELAEADGLKTKIYNSVLGYLYIFEYKPNIEVYTLKKSIE